MQKKYVQPVGTFCNGCTPTKKLTTSYRSTKNFQMRISIYGGGSENEMGNNRGSIILADVCPF